MHSAVKLIVCLAVCFAAAGLGGLATSSVTSDWYAGLNKPSFQPPGWLFGPAWTVLYTLMAIALFLVWRSGAAPSLVRPALVVFAIQLVLNVLWSVLFFAVKQPMLGLIEIVLLWVAILLTIVRFLPVSRVAAILMVPYILWVSFATVLNAAIVVLNRRS